MMGLSFSDDVLGFGKMFGERSGTEECGSRPTLAGKGRNEYNDCLRRVEERKKEVALAQINAQKDIEMSRLNKPQNGLLSIKNLIIAAGIIILLIIILKR